MATKHLDGKVALVTGGAGGIGQWVSRVLAEQGAKVVVADAGVDVNGQIGGDSSRSDAVVQAIKDAGGEALSVLGDVADMDDAERFVKTAIDTYGKLDILVCPHGILRERMIFNMQEDEWDGVVRVHLKGCFAVTKFASIYWRQARTGGRVIYFTSSSGIRGDSGQPNYAAAQAGKVGLMLSTAQALARYGVTANCISPFGATRMNDRTPDGVEWQQNRGVPRSVESSGTAIDAKNVVPAIVYLASDQGANVSGRVFGCTGHRINVWHEMEWENSIYSPEPLWDIDKLFEVMPKTLGATGWELPPQQTP